MLNPKVYNSICCFREFVAKNTAKFLAIGIVCLLGIIMGVRGGIVITDASGYMLAHPTDVFLLIIRQKSVFGCFFSDLITYAIIVIMLTCCALNYFTSYLCFIIIFFRSYLFSLHMALYIIIFKFTALPLILLCLAPCFIFSTFVFAVMSVMSLNRAKEVRLYGCSRNSTFIIHVKNMALPCIVLGILLIISSVLLYFLALGIIL